MRPTLTPSYTSLERMGNRMKDVNTKKYFDGDECDCENDDAVNKDKF